MIVGIIIGVVMYYRKKRREEIPQVENESVSLDKLDNSPQSKRKSPFSSPYKCSMPNMTCGVVNPNLTSSIDSPSPKCNGFLEFNSSFQNNSGDSYESPYSQISSVGSVCAQSPPPPVYQSTNSLMRGSSAGPDLKTSPATIRRSPACMLRMAGRTIVNHSPRHSNVWHQCSSIGYSKAKCNDIQFRLFSVNSKRAPLKTAVQVQDVGCLAT